MMKIKHPRFFRFARRTALFLVLLQLLFLTPSCTTSASYYAYTEAAFVAEVEGNLYQTQTRAKIAAVPFDQGYFIEVEFLSPQSLKGLTLTGSCNREGEAIGELTYHSFGTGGTVDAALCRDLLLPVTVFLSQREPMRVEHRHEGYLLTFSDDGLLQLNHRSLPTRIRSAEVDFWVVWWKNHTKDS